MAAKLDAGAAAAGPSGQIPGLAADGLEVDESAWPGKDLPRRDGFHVIHDSFRRDFVVLITAIRTLLERSARGETAAAAVNCSRIRQWWGTDLLPSLESHHDNEEKVLLPMLASRAGKAGLVIPDRVAADHRWLMERCGRISAQLRDAADSEAGRSTEALGRLLAVAEELSVRLSAHLDEEEATLPRLMRRLFTRGDYATMGRRIAMSEARHGLKSVARMTYDASAEDRALLYHEVGCLAGCVRSCV